MTTVAAWAALVGTAAGCMWARSAWHLAAAGALLVMALAVRSRPGIRLAVALTGLVLLGSGAAVARGTLMDGTSVAVLARAGGVARVTATVVTEPRSSDHGAWMLLRVTSVDGRPARARALLRTPTLDEAPPYGARLAMTASARPLDREGFERHLRRLHAAVEVSPRGAASVVTGPGHVARATNVIRARTRAAARAHLPADPAALLAGLVTGDVEGLSAPAQDALTAAGLTHLVAVSGSNVALVIGGAIGLAAVCGLGARGRRRAALGAMLAFAVLVRAEPSVLRATTMALFVLAGQATGRGSDARHTLPAAALVLLLVDPFLAGQLGFLLSVLATAGVLVLGPLIADRVPGPRPLALLVGASAGAQIGVAPALLVVQGAIPLASLAANLVAVPAAALASVIGISAAVLAQVAIAPAGVVAGMALPALHVVLWSGRTFAAGPVLGPADLLVPVVVVLLATVVTRRRAPRLAAAAVAVALAVGVLPDVRVAGSVEHLRLTALDIGQGDALLVEAPGDRGPVRMLVDGGPDPDAALRALRRRGIRRLDVVAVSHPHADHTNGLPAVLTSIDTGAVLVAPPIRAGADGLAASSVAVTVVARGRGIPVVTVAAGQRFSLGTAVVEVLGPPGDGSLGEEPNENSLVLRVSGRDGRILLTGDVEKASQARLMARPDLLVADVLKVPHHGGATNLDGFLDAVGARLAVISAGRDNDYGHPSDDVLADLAGTPLLRTDQTGDVTVELRPGGPVALRR